MAEAVISLRQLNITFGTHTVLDNIDLEILTLMFTRAKRWRCLALPAPAKVRCCAR